MDNNVLVAVEQVLVSFHGNKIFAFRLADGRIVASLGSLCKMLKLAKHSQLARIQRDKGLAEHLLRILVETPNGSQHVDTLIAEAIADWVKGIQVNLIAVEKRPLVNLIKEQAYEAFSRALLKTETGQAAKSTPEPEAEPLSPPPRSGWGTMSDSPWEQLFEGLDGVQEGLGGAQAGLSSVQEALYDIQREEQAKDRRLVVHEEWLTSLDRRVAGAGQGSTGKSGWIPLLSAAHLADVLILLRSLERTTGRTQKQLEQEMIETFRVPAINAIPDEQWEDVLEWGLWRAQQPRDVEGSEPL